MMKNFQSLMNEAPPSPPRNLKVRTISIGQIFKLKAPLVQLPTSAASINAISVDPGSPIRRQPGEAYLYVTPSNKRHSPVIHSQTQSNQLVSTKLNKSISPEVQAKHMRLKSAVSIRLRSDSLKKSTPPPSQQQSMVSKNNNKTTNLFTVLPVQHYSHPCFPKRIKSIRTSNSKDVFNLKNNKIVTDGEVVRMMLREEEQELSRKRQAKTVGKNNFFSDRNNTLISTGCSDYYTRYSSTKNNTNSDGTCVTSLDKLEEQRFQGLGFPSVDISVRDNSTLTVTPPDEVYPLKQVQYNFNRSWKKVHVHSRTSEDIQSDSDLPMPFKRAPNKRRAKEGSNAQQLLSPWGGAEIMDEIIDF